MDKIMNKSILLISPLEEFLLNPKEFMPLGVLYLSSYLKKLGYNVDVLHGNTEDIKKEYDYYGISSSTPQYPKAKKFLDFIRGINPKANVILGGAHTTSPHCANDSLKDGFDYIVQGQGEKALLSIIKGFSQKGIIKGTPLNNQELDNLIPDRNALNISEYGYPLENGKAATLITTRGCPYKCSFCSSSDCDLTFRSSKKVLEEINSLVNESGFDRLLFLDDSFTIKRQRITEILSGLSNYNILYRCYARADNSSDNSLLQLMKNSGCIELGAGIESGSQEILDLTNKFTKVKDNIDFIKRAQEIGIDINAFVMIGLPGENRKTIEETREFMEFTHPNKFGYNIFTPYPDCPIVLNYEKPFTRGPYFGKSFKDFITLYPMPYEKTIAKSQSIDHCFVSTPDLSREEIIQAYHQEFEKLVNITGFDPRKRGDRNKSN